MLTTNLRLDAEMHRWLVEVFWYLEYRADFIDPDMFRIEVEKVRAFQQLFRATMEEAAEAADTPEEVEVTRDDLWWLDYYVMAAREYSARSTETGLLNVDDEDLQYLQQWLSQARDRLRPH